MTLGPSESGSATLAILTDIIHRLGPDNIVSLMAATIYGSTGAGPMWEAVVDLRLPVSFHILTSGEGRRWRGPGMNGFLGIFHSNQDLLGTLIFGGVFDRHPDLCGPNQQRPEGAHEYVIS